jgi:hypothetical protein
MAGPQLFREQPVAVRQSDRHAIRTRASARARSVCEVTASGIATGRPPIMETVHQRGRVRDPPVERDPAEPSPDDRVGHLAAQRLITQPMAELEEHQPQVDLHRRGGPAQPRMEERYERREERRIVEQRSDPASSSGSRSSSSGSTPQNHLAACVRSIRPRLPCSPPGSGHSPGHSTLSMGGAPTVCAAQKLKSLYFFRSK